MFKSLFLAALFLCAGPALAGVTYDSETRSIAISGQSSDFQVLLAQKIFAESEVKTVHMWGPGGSFYAGLEMGRLIAAEGARVIVPAEKTCVSACALAAMGSAEVIVDGALWIHAPFYMMVPAIGWSIEDIARKYGEGYADMTIYLLEMGFTAGFSKQILQSTSPCKFIVWDTGKHVTDARGADRVFGYKKVDKCK